MCDYYFYLGELTRALMDQLAFEFDKTYLSGVDKIEGP
jgi:hypothetical protein